MFPVLQDGSSCYLAILDAAQDSTLEEVNIFASGLDNKSVPKFFGVFIKVIGGGDDCWGKNKSAGEKVKGGNYIKTG